MQRGVIAWFPEGDQNHAILLDELSPEGGGELEEILVLLEIERRFQTGASSQLVNKESVLEVFSVELLSCVQAQVSQG